MIIYNLLIPSAVYCVAKVIHFTLSIVLFCRLWPVSLSLPVCYVNSTRKRKVGKQTYSLLGNLKKASNNNNDSVSEEEEDRRLIPFPAKNKLIRQRRHSETALLWVGFLLIGFLFFRMIAWAPVGNALVYVAEDNNLYFRKVPGSMMPKH